MLLSLAIAFTTKSLLPLHSLDRRQSTNVHTQAFPTQHVAISAVFKCQAMAYRLQVYRERTQKLSAQTMLYVYIYIYIHISRYYRYNLSTLTVMFKASSINVVVYKWIRGMVV